MRLNVSWPDVQLYEVSNQIICPKAISNITYKWYVNTNIIDNKKTLSFKLMSNGMEFLEFDNKSSNFDEIFLRCDQKGQNVQSFYQVLNSK